MPNKAQLVTRQETTGTNTENLNKGSKLTFAEMDLNFIGLRDQSFGVADDTSTVIDVGAGNTLTVAGSGSVSTAASGQTLTITGTGITATSTDTLENKTIDTANNTITINEADISDLGAYITDANITMVGDDSTGVTFSAKDNDNIKFAGGTNITTAVSGDTVTITGPDLSSYATTSYVDTQDANIASDTLTFTNKTFDANGTGNSISNIEVADFASGVIDTDITAVSASDDTLASAKAIKTYIDSQNTAQALTFVGDDSTGTAVNSGETFKIAGGTNITTAVTGDTLTVTGPDLTSYITATSTDVLQNKTIDTANNTITITESDISDLGSYITASSTDTLTNKTFDVEGTGNSISNIDVADLKSGVLDTDLSTVSASDDTLASAKAIKTYADTKLSDVVSDTTPQLGGDLDAQTNNITNLGTLNTHTVPGGTGTLALTSDITFTDVVSDTTPQLGGDLDVNGNSIVSVSNGNIVIQPNGTGDVDLDGEVRFNKNYKEDINSLTSSSTITVDCTLSAIHTVTLATNTEFNITGLPTGGSVTLIITQDVTGTRTATFGTDGSTAVKFAGGTPTLSTAGGSIDVVTIFNDGTNYLGNLAKAFAA